MRLQCASSPSNEGYTGWRTLLASIWVSCSRLLRRIASTSCTRTAMSTTTPLFPTAPTSSDLFVNPRTATSSSAAATTTSNNNNSGYGWGGGGYGNGQSAYFQTVVISLVALAVLLVISVVCLCRLCPGHPPNSSHLQDVLVLSPKTTPLLSGRRMAIPHASRQWTSRSPKKGGEGLWGGARDV